MHGGTNPGAPKRDSNARKYGGRSREKAQAAQALKALSRLIDYRKTTCRLSLLAKEHHAQVSIHITAEDVRLKHLHDGLKAHLLEGGN